MLMAARQGALVAICCSCVLLRVYIYIVVCVLSGTSVVVCRVVSVVAFVLQNTSCCFALFPSGARNSPWLYNCEALYEVCLPLVAVLLASDSIIGILCGNDV